MLRQSILSRSPKPSAKKKKPNEPHEAAETSSTVAKRIKEKFCSDISGHIVRHLKPYYNDACEVGRIRSTEDFRFLARKVICD